MKMENLNIVEMLLNVHYLKWLTNLDMITDKFVKTLEIKLKRSSLSVQKERR